MIIIHNADGYIHTAVITCTSLTLFPFYLISRGRTKFKRSKIYITLFLYEKIRNGGWEKIR